MKKKDANWDKVKCQLLEDYGGICWNCLKRLPRSKLTMHHVHEFHITHHTRYSDAIILCEHCHFDVINKIKYNSDEYWAKMNEIAEKMDSIYSYPYRFKRE